MANLKFQRKLEDFTCSQCHTFVKGSGFTDHCHNCLWSAHVDVFPGDRQEKCLGLMKPTSAAVKGQGYKIFYQCQKCGYEHQVKAQKDDNLAIIIDLIKQPS